MRFKVSAVGLALVASAFGIGQASAFSEQTVGGASTSQQFQDPDEKIGSGVLDTGIPTDVQSGYSEKQEPGESKSGFSFSVNPNQSTTTDQPFGPWTIHH